MFWVFGYGVLFDSIWHVDTCMLTLRCGRDQHPDVYGRALLGAASRDRSSAFDAAEDVWSAGATLYHVATGQQPFRPHGGRNNKDMMFV